MSFLKNSLLRGIGQELGKAVGKAITNAVGPAVNQQTGQHQSPYQQQPTQPSWGTNNPLAGLERTLQGYATQVSQNLKVCPNCEKPASAEQTFCPHCGTKLPEETLAQGAVCPQCGKQNGLGMKFCQDCGAKLPHAVAADEASAAKDAEVLAEWDEKLPYYPKWCFGGRNYYIESYDEGTYLFSANFDGNSMAAQNAVAQYRQYLTQCGFRPAGMYPSMEHLYQRINGVVYHVDTEHCFEGDPDTASIGFLTGEPHGGFDYVKPEPKKTASWQDLFKL